MSIVDPFTVVVNESSSKSDGDLAPHYAMKFALQTLRDRCSKLQTRISRLEEENLHLRISKSKEIDFVKESQLQNLNSVNKGISSFVNSYENNQNLWVKVSQNYKEKSLPKVNLISTSNDFPMSNQIVKSALKNEDNKVKEDSLEEISLRETVYGRTGHSSKDKSEPNVDGEYAEDDFESLEVSLKEILKKMKKDQDMLKQQQEGLKSALEIFKKVIKEYSICKSCLKREEGVKGRILENKIVGGEESLGSSRSELEAYPRRERIRVPIPTTVDEGPPFKDRICPLCEKYFHCSTPFDTFNEHVLSHFIEDEDDDGKISNTFEVIT